METKYPLETLDPDADDGTMPDNVEQLKNAVVGHRIVSANIEEAPHSWRQEPALVLTLDDGTKVSLHNTDDCCAHTTLDAFLLDPAGVDHVIMGVGTTEEYQVWHIYADYGDVLKLDLEWSCGNPFYYGYGFDINVIPHE